MATTENLIIGGLNLGACVVKSDRSPINDGIVKLRTLGGQERIHYFYEKFEYEFDLLITVEQLTNLIAVLSGYPLTSVTYLRTDFLLNNTNCVVTIEDENYADYLYQPVNGAANTMYVDIKIKCVTQ